MTRPPVEARRATSDDLDDLVMLWSHAREELGRTGRPLSVPPLDQVRARLLEAVDGTAEIIVLVGRYEGAAAGYAVLRLAPVLLVEGDALHIEHLFVLPSARRRGVARAMLVTATSVAERRGAEQVMAGAPPSARESHRFLARLGFSPLVVRRVVATSALRRRLAGEGPRRGLDDLLSRRRSLRARSLRAGWGGARWPDPRPVDGPAVRTQARAPQESAGPVRTITVAEGAVRRIDLAGAAGAVCPLPSLSPGPGTGPGAAPGPVPAATAATERSTGAGEAATVPPSVARPAPDGPAGDA